MIKPESKGLSNRAWMGSSAITPNYSMSKKIFQVIFIIAALMMFGALLFHVKGFFYPVPPTPPWRHAIFVAVTALCIYGVLKRPRWFIWFTGILTVQQWYSHGSYALEFWQKQHSIHWISMGVIVFMPLLFIVLLLEKRSTN